MVKVVSRSRVAACPSSPMANEKCTRALRLMESRQVDPTVLVADEFKLEEALKAFERAAETGVLKVLVKA